MNRLYKHIAITITAHRHALVCAWVLLLAAHATHAQVTRYIANGNDLYNQGKYKEAAANYAKALEKNPNYTPGLFNLSNSLYGQKKYDSSRKVMETTAKVATDKKGKAAANYNIGNTYMAEKKWDEAIKAYKQTLRNNPLDGDAKYNLSYASKMKAKEEEQKKQDDKNKKDDKKDQQKNKDDKKKDDKNKDDQKDNKENDKDKDKEKEQPQPQQQPSKISKQAAEQLLNALQNEEKKLQDKMKKEKGVPVKPDKDW